MPARNSAPFGSARAPFPAGSGRGGASRRHAGGHRGETVHSLASFEPSDSSPRCDLHRILSGPCSAQSASCPAGISTAVFRRRSGSEAACRSPDTCLPRGPREPVHHPTCSGAGPAEDFSVFRPAVMCFKKSVSLYSNTSSGIPARTDGACDAWAWSRTSPTTALS